MDAFQMSLFFEGITEIPEQACSSKDLLVILHNKAYLSTTKTMRGWQQPRSQLKRSVFNIENINTPSENVENDNEQRNPQKINKA